MRKSFVLIITIFLCFSIQSQIQNTEKTFVLDAQISGLEIGDTLIADHVLLPDYKEEFIDTIFVEQQGKFTYKKPLSHTSLIIFIHMPKGRPPIETSLRGASILAAPGDLVNIKGSVEYFAAVQKSGGFYSDAVIAKFDHLDTSFDISMIDAFRKISDARKTQQTDSINKYIQIYNNLTSPQELKDVRNYIINDIHNNEFSAYLYLSRLHDTTFKELNERYAKYTSEIQASYMGKRLNHMLKVLKNIEVGSRPSDFTVTDINNSKIKLSDYKGKYVLIYNWGPCAATIWIHPQITDLYKKFNNKGFEIIGFSRKDYSKDYIGVEELKDLLSLHPWTTVYTENEGNGFIGEDLYFAGMPILMLISPDGTTLTRGYTEVFEPTKKILEENLEN